MNFWAVLFGPSISAICSGLVVWFISRSAKSRDGRLERIEATLADLASKVGVQNGRVGKLEYGSKETHDTVQGILKRELDRLNAEVVEARASARRRGK